MSLFSAFAIYFIIWWVTLFIVLPYGNRSQAEEGEVILGTDPGAPIISRLPQKLLINTLFSAFIFAIYWFVTDWIGLGFSDIPSIFPEHLRPHG